MMRALFAGVSGLRNHQTRMDVIGNNIANVNTTGFKASRVTFKEAFVQLLQGAARPGGSAGGINPIQIGTGVNVGSTDQLYTQGSFETTGQPLDLAIQGDGLFVVNNGQRNLYTRAGNFQLDAQGNLISPGSGFMVQGINADAQGNFSSTSSIGNIPFGQGVSVTPLQLVRAIGAIANDGQLTTPHFLLDVPGSSESLPVWPSRRAISVKTADSVTKMLRAVVTKGTGKEAKVRGYTVAGKTGTAQKAKSGGGGYSGGKYVGSFIGYLPAEDPQVLVCVILDEPTRGIYGGAIAAPTFSTLSRFTVSHLKIPPSSALQSDEPAAPSKGAASGGVGPVSDEGARD